MATAIIIAGALIAVIISWCMPTVQDYRRELDNINYRLSMIDGELARIADSLARIAEKMGDSE